MRITNRSGFTIRHMIFVQGFILLIGLWFNLWVIPSAITSGVKAIADKCGHTYPVEKVWSGDWFCGEKDGK